MNAKWPWVFPIFHMPYPGEWFYIRAQGVLSINLADSLSFLIHSINIYWVRILCRHCSGQKKKTNLPSWNSHFGGGNRPGRVYFSQLTSKNIAEIQVRRPQTLWKTYCYNTGEKLLLQKPDSEILKLEAHTISLPDPGLLPTAQSLDLTPT